MDLLPATFALKPLLHCLCSGGERVRSTVPRDSVCIKIRPKFSRGPLPSHVRAEAAPHGMCSGSELVRSTVPRDSVGTLSRPKFKLEEDVPNGAPPDGGRAETTAAAPAGGGSVCQACAGADPALHERRQRAVREAPC